MREEEKRRAYYKLAREVLDYTWNCADRGMVPLRHDVDVFMSRLNRLRLEKVER